MNEKIIDFINRHEELIDNNEWEEIYKKAHSAFLFPYEGVGEFTKILLDAGIHPENYLSELPEHFL